MRKHRLSIDRLQSLSQLRSKVKGVSRRWSCCWCNSTVETGSVIEEAFWSIPRPAWFLPRLPGICAFSTELCSAREFSAARPAFFYSSTISGLPAPRDCLRRRSVNVDPTCRPRLRRCRNQRPFPNWTLHRLKRKTDTQIYVTVARDSVVELHVHCFNSTFVLICPLSWGHRSSILYLTAKIINYRL